jgi:hypothetical protein
MKLSLSAPELVVQASCGNMYMLLLWPLPIHCQLICGLCGLFNLPVYDPHGCLLLLVFRVFSPTVSHTVA